MKILSREISIAILIIVAGLFQSCYATPTDDDVSRVKQHFLASRFNAPFDPEQSRLKDIELFRESCIANRVRCDAVLGKLEKSEPEFYKKLLENGSSADK